MDNVFVINVDEHTMSKVHTLKLDNAVTRTFLTDLIKARFTYTFEKYCNNYPKPEKYSDYLTLNDLAATSKADKRKITVTKKTKEGVEKEAQVEPKMYINNVKALRETLNYFLIKYTLELLKIYEIKKKDLKYTTPIVDVLTDSGNYIVNSCIPYVIMGANLNNPKEDSEDIQFTFEYKKMNDIITAFFKSNNGGGAKPQVLTAIRAVIEKLYQFMNVVIDQCFYTSVIAKSLPNSNYLVGICLHIGVQNYARYKLLENESNRNEMYDGVLSESLLSDLLNFIKSYNTKPESTGKKAKKTGTKKTSAKKSGGKNKKSDVDDDENEDNDNDNDDENGDGNDDDIISDEYDTI